MFPATESCKFIVTYTRVRAKNSHGGAPFFRAEDCPLQDPWIENTTRHKIAALQESLGIVWLLARARSTIRIGFSNGSLSSPTKTSLHLQMTTYRHTSGAPLPGRRAVRSAQREYRYWCCVSAFDALDELKGISALPQMLPRVVHKPELSRPISVYTRKQQPTTI
jgi:hypothetical protein